MCQRCNKKGHWIQDCPLLPQDRMNFERIFNQNIVNFQNNNQFGQNNVTNTNTNTACFNCGQQGHFSINCQYRQNKN